ncbi:MAG: biotin/lipoyl-binding protein [Bacteroidia bacterium]
MAKVSVDKEWFEILTSEDGQLSIDGQKLEYDLVRITKHEYHLLLNNRSFTVEILDKARDGSLSLSINGRKLEGRLSYKIEQLLKSMGMETGKKVHKDVKAPMPGLVLDVLVQEGQTVDESQDLVILEAMKMENALKAPQAGVIDVVHVNKQDKVDKNQVLISYQ